MASAGAERISTTTDKPTIWGRSRGPHGGARHRDQEDTSSAERRKERKRKSEQNAFPLTLTGVIEQWVCLALGIACMLSGIVGVAMNPDQYELPVSIPWLKSIYVPLLRITAAACLTLGVVLICLGWRGPIAQADSSHMQIDKEES